MRADKLPIREQIVAAVRRAPGITVYQISQRINRRRDMVAWRCYRLFVEGVLDRSHGDETSWQYYVK